MKTFRRHLRESLKDPEFKQLYDEEKELLDLSMKLQEARQKSGASQKKVAKDAQLTQQQLSKIENGENCNILTYLKASRAVGYRLTLQRLKLSSNELHV
jgi:HTH-type transcriptional regulator / antitoxin HipB